MRHHPATTYNAAYVPMKEPNPATGEFDPHVYACLGMARDLLEMGVVEGIVVAGGEAKWFAQEGVKSPVSSEGQWGRQHLLELGVSPDNIKDEDTSQTSVGNHVLTAENVFAPEGTEGMESVLMITAEDRAVRLYRLGAHVLYGVVPTFHFTTVGTAPELAAKEAFTLRMQQQYLLGHVPRGRAGWDELRATNFDGHLLQEFWIKFDEAHNRLRAARPGATFEMQTIVANMDDGGLEDGIKRFAFTAAAAGNLVLPDHTLEPGYRPIEKLLPVRASQ